MSASAESVTAGVVVDEAAQAAAAAALETANADGKTGDESTGEPAADEVVVTIGDAEPSKDEQEIAAAPEWVRELRKTNREQARRLRELEQQARAGADSAAVVLGAKPKMSDAQIDYDAEKFEAALSKWNDQKRAADAEEAQKQAAEKQAQESWQTQLNAYGEAKAALKVKDFADAEAAAMESLAQVQQGIIVQGAKNPALVVYALGKNPAKLAELKAITDPVKFAFAIANLEGDLKVTTRKPPPPEKVVNGSGSKVGATDSTLERLRSEAEKTGDFSKVVAHKRAQRVAS